MKVEKKQLDKVQVELTIEVPEEDFKKEYVEKAYRDRKGKINIPGFRKGHAPRQLIEQYYGKDFFYFDAAEMCVFPMYVEAIKENEDIKPIAEPKFDVVTLEAGKPFVFTATVDTKQEITLGNYEGIELEKVDTTVSDEDIQKEIDHARENTALIIDVEDENATVENGDIVLLDFCGKKDGVAFEGGTAENYELTIGSNSFIPGFEEGMIGMKLGEEKDLNLSFPEEYHAKDLAGADVVFTVKVNAIKRKELAPVDDDFAKDVSDFDTLDEYKANLREEMETQRKEAAQNQYKSKIAEKVTADSDVVAPPSMVEKESENYLNEMTYNLRAQGIEMEQYYQLTHTTEEDVKKEFTERAEASVKQQLVLAEIAERENIEVSEEELDAEFEKLSKYYQMEKDQLKQIFMVQGQTESLKNSIKFEKVMNLLLDKAVIK
ncbi:MAG: trigger factor [Peptococcaceae bacterium]|nr:trigger factor [Peptococcaceae bacterium]